jgi:subtilisin family serine protease/subtilisin-like proprotein convertase family protein
VSSQHRRAGNRFLFSRSFEVEALESRDVPSGGIASFDQLNFDFQNYDQNHIVVGLQSGSTLTELSAIGTTVTRFDNALDLGEGMYRLELQPGQTVEGALAFFQLVSTVRFAQADYQVRVTAVPNDPSYSSQYGLRNIDAATAWNTTTGSGRTIVAVIDTGVDYTHPDLAANIWTNTREIAGNGIDDDGNGFIDDIRGWDFHNNDNNPMDDNGHGTHVAGIIGAVGNNGVGISGVNWRVQIMPVKFLSSTGSGSMSNAIRALNYAVANGAAVSNNSYGGGGFYQAFYDAIAGARARGHIFVAAAGNNSANTDTTPHYPGSYNLDNMVTVAATDSADRLASYSNYGAVSVDLGAPGSSIYSTLPNNRYGTMSGTSMASPFVAGAIALVRDRNPSWTYRQVIQQVLSTTDSLSVLSGKTVSGGRLNLARALGASSGGGGGTGSGAMVTSASFSGATAGTLNKVRVTFNKAVNASTFTIADIAAFTRNGTAVSGVTYTVTPVSGTTNQFDVGFTTQTVAGTYQMTIGADIRDTAGNQMDQNANGINGEVPYDRYTVSGSISGAYTFHSTDVNRTIADGMRTVSVLQVNQDLTIGQLSVKLNLSHTYDSDLQIYLQGPDGTVVTLFNRRGGSGDNVMATFDDAASIGIASGAAPFNGTFRSEQALSAFTGTNARGQWRLVVDDVAMFDTGVISAWSISVTTGGGGAGARSNEVAGEIGAAAAKALPQLIQPASVSMPQWSTTSTQMTRQQDYHRNEFVVESAQAVQRADWLDDGCFAETPAATSLLEWIATDECETDWIEVE